MEEEIVVEKLKSTQPEIVLLTGAVQVEYPSCAIYKKSKNLLNCVLNSYSRCVFFANLFLKTKISVLKHTIYSIWLRDTS